jgi:hypothetical protein
MDMPALYSLVRPDGQKCDVMLTEESNSIKSGYAFSAQARLNFSFKTKVPGIFGADRSARNGHPFSAISEFSDWESTGIKRGLRGQPAASQRMKVIQRNHQPWVPSNLQGE